MRIIQNNGKSKYLHLEQDSSGTIELEGLVIGETPSGAVNGSNAIFTTEFDFVPETVQPFIAGMTLKKLEDYNTSGANTIIFNSSPQPGENIIVNYVKI